MNQLIDPDRLRAALAKLRESIDALRDGGMTIKGGMRDRVRMQVVGPDGEVKRETDTG